MGSFIAIGSLGAFATEPIERQKRLRQYSIAQLLDSLIPSYGIREATLMREKERETVATSAMSFQHCWRIETLVAVVAYEPSFSQRNGCDFLVMV